MIIVSFTTIPERLIKNLPAVCIESILKQTVKPDFIIVNIPEISSKGEKYSLEHVKKLIENYPSVTVQYGTQNGTQNGVKDLGPITKIVPTLNFIKNTIDQTSSISIILVDDDCSYEPYMIENLITAKKRCPNELVIGTAGRKKYRNKMEFIGTVYNHPPSDSIMPNYIYVDIIETFAGVLYDYSLFNDSLISPNFIDWISKLPSFVMLADDIILSSWAKLQGANLYKIIQTRQIVKHDPKQTTELNTINDKEGNNDKVFDYFEDLLRLERIKKLIKQANKLSQATA